MVQLVRLVFHTCPARLVTVVLQLELRKIWRPSCDVEEDKHHQKERNLARSTCDCCVARAESHSANDFYHFKGGVCVRGGVVD